MSKEKIVGLVPLGLFAALIFYYECVLGFSVHGGGFVASLPHVLLASLYFGLIPGLIILFIKGKWNKIATVVVSLLLMVPFFVEIFIYEQFKVLYDINTIVNGQDDALTGFMGTILEILFSPLGILRIVLFLAPSVALIILMAKHKFPASDVSKRTKIIALLLIPVAFLANYALIRISDNKYNIYKKEYSFQNAEEKFGLSETLRLDLHYLIWGRNDEFGSQEDREDVNAILDAAQELAPTATPTPTPIPVPTVPDATPTPTPSPTPTPAPQVMDIDFDDLAENSSGRIQQLNEYCASLEPSMTNEYTGMFEGKNLVLITAEAFTAEAIDPVLTPTLYRMATQGINFNDFYVPASAGTTGGEFSNIFGMLPMDGGSSVPHMTSRGNAYFNMGAALDREGYYGIAYHNNDYTYYTRHQTHNRLGYSEGYIGWGNGLEEFVDPVWPESDLQMFEATVPTYINQEHFNVYYMTVSGHSNYSRGANAQSRAHWDETESLDGVCSERVRAYKAANIELDRSMEYLISELEACGKADDTVIVICADHFPYGLDRDAPPGNMPYLSELYGYEVTNYVERDHNRLIMWCGSLEEQDPIVVDSPVSSIDILPTLLNLFGCEWDSRLLPGRDVFSDTMPIYFNTNYDWKTDLGTYLSSRGQFIPADESIVIPDGYVDAVRSLVSDKMTYMRGVLSTGYFNYLFGVNEGTEPAVGH